MEFDYKNKSSMNLALIASRYNYLIHSKGKDDYNELANITKHLLNEFSIDEIKSMLKLNNKIYSDHNLNIEDVIYCYLLTNILTCRSYTYRFIFEVENYDRI